MLYAVQIGEKRASDVNVGCNNILYTIIIRSWELSMEFCKKYAGEHIKYTKVYLKWEVCLSSLPGAENYNKQCMDGNVSYGWPILTREESNGFW